MTTGYSVTSIMEILVAMLLIYGLFFEDKLVRLEDKFMIFIKRKVIRFLKKRLARSVSPVPNTRKRKQRALHL